MLTSAQRARLRGIAQQLDPIFNVGKNLIGDNMIKDIDAALEAHELIKLGVLKSADIPAKAAMEEICARLGAEPVGAIGSKFVIYRQSSRDDIKHIEF